MSSKVDANQDGIFADLSETVLEGTRQVDNRFTVTAGNNASTDVLTVASLVDNDLPGVTSEQLLAASSRPTAAATSWRPTPR